ncbi:MAG: glutamine synthetase, partial [Rhodobacteraceae bacterium]|nr:glutamine synthetase [Paracoccaceae bacterium]
LNPYLACAGLLAAGLAGIAQGLELEPEMRGDSYQNAGAREIPRTLRHAADLLEGSAMLRAAFGDAVVNHYTRAARWEIEEHDRVVTDWERRRLLERG